MSRGFAMFAAPQGITTLGMWWVRTWHTYCRN